MLVLMLIVVSIAFVVTLALYMFGPSRTSPKALPAAAAPASQDARPRPNLEGELEKKRRELEEQRKEAQELRAELKLTKKKLFEQRDSGKGDQDLVKARAEVERQASLQLESTRSELASALAQLAKLKSEAESNRRKPAGAVALVEPAGKPLEVPVPVAATVTATVEKPERRFRELNDADKEKMDRLEHQAAKDRARAAELEREVKRLKGRTETQNRVFVVTKGELDLVKDKFKALEKRLNRTLLERDLLRRAIRDLEKKSGVAAERTELTQEEISASDQKVDERVKAEAAEAERRASVAKAEPEAQAPAATPGTAGTEPAGASSDTSGSSEASSPPEADASTQH